MTWLAYSHLGVAKVVQLTTQPAGARVGVPFGTQPVGRLVDGSGVLSRATGVTVTASKASGTGTLSGTLSVQTVEGVFTFTDLKMDTLTSAVTLQFASSGLTSAVSTVFNVTQPNTSIGIEVGAYAVTGVAATLSRTRVCACVPGSYAVSGTPATLNGTVSPTTIALSAGNNQTAAVSTPVAINPAVLVTGAGSVPVPGVTVTWTVTAGGGSVSPSTSSTNASGIATTQWTMGSSAGTDTMEASASGPSASAQLLFAETFANTSFSARGWYDIGATDRVSTPAPPGAPGSLRCAWDAGATLPSSSLMRKTFAPQDRLYWTYKIQFSSNWVGSGQSDHPHLHRVLTNAESDDYAGFSDVWLGIAEEVNYQGGTLSRLSFQDNQAIDPAHINTTVYASPADLLAATGIGENRSVSGANGRLGDCDSWDIFADGSYSNGYFAARRFMSATPVVATANTAWHTVECEVILNSVVGGIGQMDGVARLWWDGVLIESHTNLLMRTGLPNPLPTTSFGGRVRSSGIPRASLQFNQFAIAPIIGSGSPVAQTLYVSDLQVWTAKP